MEERICPLCNNAVESEVHFLLECTFFDREMFFHDLGIDNNLDSIEKLKLCMSEHQKETVRFLCDLWKQRQKFLFGM